MTAAEWAVDDEGNEWPITGAWCAACGMPAEPGDVAHPSCLPPRKRGIPRKTEREIRWGLLYDELGAVPDLSRPCSACGKPLAPPRGRRRAAAPGLLGRGATTALAPRPTATTSMTETPEQETPPAGTSRRGHQPLEME